MFKNLSRGACALLAALAACAARRSGRAATGIDAGRRQGAAGRRLRLRDAGRRGRLDLPARARPARDGARPRRARQDDRGRVGRRGRRRRARHARPGRAAGRDARLRDQLRLPRAGAARRRRVPARPLRARRRLQERAQPRHLRRPLLRGALAGRLARRANEQERRRRLRRRLPGARGRAGHQCVRARHARRQPERDGARGLARTPGSTRRRSATQRSR